MSNNGAWIGVDLDGTLAHYEQWPGDATIIGEPVMPMIERVKVWLARGVEVRIFTARVAAAEPERSHIIAAIGAWCATHIGQPLAVTCQKDFGMIELWDDRCVQVEPNTGKPVGAPREDGT